MTIDTTPIYIENKMYTNLNVSIGNGEIVKLSCKGLGKDVGIVHFKA